MGGRSNARDLSTDVVALRRALLRWYDRVRRPFPWRNDRDPYRVWVAEVMLQQTRIAVVEPAYERFLGAFPSLERLAVATEDEVMSLWSGLGYYTRARSLHRAVRELAAAGRRFPRDYAAARRLPGVGAYTAAAVLSIAYGESLAAVDGNVVRVLARLRRLGLPDGRGEPHAAIAAQLLDARRPGDWNQAVMELGETVCTPSSPRCGECPIARHCEAHRAGVVARHPPVKRRRATENVTATMMMIRNRRGDLALERGVFSYLPRMWLPVLARGVAAGEPIGEIRHAITYRSFRIRVLTRQAGAAEFSRVLRSGGAGERRAFSATDLQQIGRSSLLHKALALEQSAEPGSPSS